jgi:hypothetical protein
MKKPNIIYQNPDANYIRDLLTSANLSQRKAAELLGINERTFRRYCANNECPYVVQYCLEALATLTD